MKITLASVGAALCLAGLTTMAGAAEKPADKAPAAKPAAAKAAPAGKSCVLAGGTADMLTEDLARFMANAAMNNQMKAEGRKPAGPVKVVCKPGVPVNCTSTQRACK